MEPPLQHRGHILHPGNVVLAAAEHLWAEHHRRVVQGAALQGLGGVELSAVEEHHLPGAGLEILAAAAHPHRAPLHLEELHLVVPVALQLLAVGGIGRPDAVTAHRKAHGPVLPRLFQPFVHHASPRLSQ